MNINKLKKIAENGFVKAQYLLGNWYYYGNGVEQDYEEAFKWFKKAAEQGNQKAQKRLNEINKQSQQNNEITDLIHKAQAGDVEALCKLGTHYYNGNKVEQNYNEAISSLIKCLQIIEKKHNAAVYWIKKAVEQDEAYAQDSLANCYFYGRGVKQDFEEAVKWYKKAAEQDNGVAQRNLGNCYVLGAGVPKDFEKAKMWHDKAKENGEEYDRKLLEEMAKAFNP